MPSLPAANNQTNNTEYSVCCFMSSQRKGTALKKFQEAAAHPHTLDASSHKTLTSHSTKHDAEPSIYSSALLLLAARSNESFTEPLPPLVAEFIIGQSSSSHTHHTPGLPHSLIPLTDSLTPMLPPHPFPPINDSSMAWEQPHRLPTAAWS